MTSLAAAILIELFTSEGCSSCPPADAVLARLHEKQPLAGVQLIVLSEHVDYWDDLGWRDPFSNHLFTERQSRYGSRIYTPQAVVDGHIDVLGSDSDGILLAARGASSDPHGTVQVGQVVQHAQLAHVVIRDLPPHGPAQVMLAVVEDGLTSKVLRGENKGRTLPHTAGPKNAVRQPKCARRYAASAVAANGPTWKQVLQKPITAPRSDGPYQAAIALTLPGQPVACTKPFRPKKSANKVALLEVPKAAISSAEPIMP